MQVSDIIPSSQLHQGLQEFLEVPWQGEAVVGAPTLNANKPGLQSTQLLTLWLEQSQL